MNIFLDIVSGIFWVSSVRRDRGEMGTLYIFLGNKLKKFRKKLEKMFGENVIRIRKAIINADHIMRRDVKMV